MLKGIAGRTAVVTGGSGGIGSATARRLHAEGANVVVVDLDGAGAEAVAKELGSKAVGMRADVSSPDDNAAIIAKAVETFGSVDMFHINAGVESKVIPIVNFDIADYRKVFDVNVLGAGVVDTRMMRPLEEGIGALAGVDGAAIQAAMNAAVPLGRYGQPEEIAATAAWLLSDEVPYMHGEVVTVGGGLWP